MDTNKMKELKTGYFLCSLDELIIMIEKDFSFNELLLTRKQHKNIFFYREAIRIVFDYGKMQEDGIINNIQIIDEDYSLDFVDFKYNFKRSFGRSLKKYIIQVGMNFHNDLILDVLNKTKLNVINDDYEGNGTIKRFINKDNYVCCPVRNSFQNIHNQENILIELKP